MQVIPSKWSNTVFWRKIKLSLSKVRVLSAYCKCNKKTSSSAMIKRIKLDRIFACAIKLQIDLRFKDTLLKIVKGLVLKYQK